MKGKKIPSRRDCGWRAHALGMRGRRIRRQRLRRRRRRRPHRRRDADEELGALDRRTATPSRPSSRSQGFTVDLQYAEDDIPTQVSQVENMITKGAEALIIAAIDGTTLSEVLQTAAGCRHPRHRVRPPDPRLGERRLLRDVRQLPRRPAAGVDAPQRPRPHRARRHADRRRARRSVQHRAVRRLARRQQRVLLLQRRDGRAPAADR